ncbi:MAG: precorrin-3B C(17)-methyltransferase [Coriobacteriia bacterium]|nr:precorrin-3B C(17)-methyltransferase [Coriobacteriia bacterium]
MQFSETGPAGVHVVGLGPGGGADLSGRARAAIEASDLVVGYTVYVDLLRADFPEKEFYTTPMRKEVERCRYALEQAAAGRDVAVVCSGDPGVYGMAGLVFELAQEYPSVPIEVIPGVSASNGGAAVLGAPLMHDHCLISLSDLLTPWETIERRLVAAAQADFVICLYNPSSHKRPDYLQRACDILLAHRSPDSVCGTVSNIGRVGQQSQVLTLGELRDTPVDMFTTVFIGNSQTREIDGRMVTPRGYLQRRS